MAFLNNVVMCLGHRYGTECKRVVRTTHNTSNWEDYQLCYKCAINPLTEEYREQLLITN